MYAGAAVAVGLFGVVAPAGVAWLRCLGAALVLLPVTAGIIGFLWLKQVPTLPEAFGTPAVVAGVALRSPGRRRPPPGVSGDSFRK